MKAAAEKDVPKTNNGNPVFIYPDENRIRVKLVATLSFQNYHVQNLLLPGFVYSTSHLNYCRKKHHQQTANNIVP